MVELKSIEPREYSNIGAEYIIEINDENLGRTILITLVLSYYMSPEYLFCRQFLKTKYITLGLQESELSLYLFSCQDLNTFIDYCKNPDFFKFLGKFGDYLIKNRNIYSNITEIQQVSKDLNIKIMIFEDYQLVSEGFCYEFPNPPTINIISNKSNFPYSFISKTLKPDPILESHQINEERKKLINSFGYSLTEITNKTMLTKQSKDWINDILNKYPNACHEYSFLKQLKKVKMLVGEIPVLRTEKMDIFGLKTSQSYVTTMPELFKKFAPVPEDDIMPEMYVKGDDDIEKKQVIQADEAVSDFAVDPNQVPPIRELQSDFGGAHCKNCLEMPFDFGNLECECSISTECMQKSLMSGACVGCGKSISQSDTEKFSIYFS